MSHPIHHGRPLFVMAAVSILFGLAPIVGQPLAVSQDGGEPTGFADVVVYGSTPGGFCAAIAAAREGASVILLEPTQHVGGLSTGGLSHCDSNQMVRATLMGLFDEWHRRIVQDYTRRGIEAPYDPSVKDQARWTFEPHVAQRVTNEMLHEAGVKVMVDCDLHSVRKIGRRIEALVTKKGDFAAKVFVDGTYEGDLMAAAGVDWTIGRESRNEFSESLAGRRYPKPKMEIEGLDENGDALPLITSMKEAPAGSGDRNVMTYSFRLCLTEDPENRIPLPKPAKYDPHRFEVVRRALAGGEKKVGFDLYRLPGGKWDGNNSIGGQFSIGLIGGAKHWHVSDEAGRESVWEAHRQYTLEFFHFLTTDPVVPVNIRDRFRKLGLCKDEFAAFDHFSPALYVRESRRMRGMYVLRQQDILEHPRKADPIAISSFPIDSHDCQRIALDGGGVINEGTIFPVRRGKTRQGFAYHVPYRSILPRPEHCHNLLVPVALSCTHVAMSSLRIEGTWMAIGQSAGVAAAMAAQQEVPVQQLAYAQLRERLLQQKQVLELPVPDELTENGDSIPVGSLKGIVLDDSEAELSGSWGRSQNFKPYVGKGYVFAGKARNPSETESPHVGDGQSTAVFRFVVPQTGKYLVLMAYSPHATRATNVPVMFESGDQRQTFRVDQTKKLTPGKNFRSVADVHLEAGRKTTVRISNESTDGFVILDALQFIPVN